LSPIVKLRFLVPFFAAVALAGCIGNSGDSAPPPNDITAVVGDGIAGITWRPQPDIVYLAFGSTNPDLTVQNWTDAGIAGFAILNGGTKTVPPAVICNTNPGIAPNGLSYYFTVDAHTGSAPAGAGSRTVQATPRAAGGAGTWTLGTPIGVNINGVGYATITTCLPTGLPTGIYAAVGATGAIFTSTNGATWTSRTPPGYTTDLYSVATFTGSVNVPSAPNVQFVAVGAGGASIHSLDGVTWTSTVAASGSAPILRSVTLAGGTFVAVGDGGRIQTTADGVTWTAQTSNTTANLHSIYCLDTTCIAVGDAGVVDVSLDGGLTWTVKTLTTGALRAVAYGNFDNNETGNGVVGVGNNTSINTWVVVGDNGVAFETNNLTTTVSSVTWNAVSISGAANFVAISYTTQFVAIDSAGNAFASQTGTSGTWSAAVATRITDPISVATNSHGYVLVGTSGDNTSSF
jgi:hypothetical protein